MKRWVFVLLTAAGAACALAALAGLAAKQAVNGIGKNELISSLSRATGAPVSIGRMDFSLGQLFLLRPSISLADVVLGNPPGFRAGRLLEAKEVDAQVSLMPLLRKNINVRSVRVQSPQVLLETNPQGDRNVDVLLRRLASGGKEAGAGGRMKLAIESLSVSSGEVASPTAGGRPETIARGIHATLDGLSGQGPRRVELRARLFDGSNSSLRFSGRAGPARPDSFPLEGTYAVSVAPSEIPLAVRKEQFGEMLDSPGTKARASLQGSLQGDLYGSVAGPGRLAFSDVLIGKDSKHLMMVSGAAPFTATARLTGASPRPGAGEAQKASLRAPAAARAFSPEIHVTVPDFAVRAGGGEWTGALELQARGSAIGGGSRGRMQNMNVEQLLSSFSRGGKMQGLLDIPVYSIQFAGNDAVRLVNSLSGTGKLFLKDARIAALDALGPVQQGFKEVKQLAGGGPGPAALSTLKADFRIARRVVYLDHIVLTNPNVDVTGRGTAGFNQAIHFNLNAQVKGGAASMLSQAAHLGGTGPATIPVRVTGTVNSPRVSVKIPKAKTGIASDVLQSIFGKR
jgi:hypothetical protein